MRNGIEVQKVVNLPEQNWIHVGDKGTNIWGDKIVMHETGFAVILNKGRVIAFVHEAETIIIELKKIDYPQPIKITEVAEMEMNLSGNFVCPKCNAELEKIEFESMGAGYREFENDTDKLRCPNCKSEFEITYEMACRMF